MGCADIVGLVRQCADCEWAAAKQGYINERDRPVSDEPLIHGVSLFRAVYGGLSTNYYFEVSMLKKQTHLGSKYFVNAFIFIAIFVLQAPS